MENSTAAIGWQSSPSQLKLDYLRRYAVGETALDVGCGRGWYASALADAGFVVSAIDSACGFDDPRIDVTEAVVTTLLPYPDAAFDTVVMFDILEHLPEEDAILEEVARVCRRRLILSAPHADDGFLPRYGLTYLHRTDHTHLRDYTPDSLCQKLEAHRFATHHVALEGRAHIPLVFSEFVRGGRAIRTLVRWGITALYKIGIVTNPRIAGDIFWVGDRRA
jgi:SAM-dependent methyltransferase